MRPGKSPVHQTIHIHPLAPVKPVLGAPCNGCGLCCLAEPCPLGVLLSRSRVGPCKALVWLEDSHQYRCGALAGAEADRDGAPGPLGWLMAAVVRIRTRVARRWIAAGIGCDCELERAESSTIHASTPHT